MKKYKIQNRSTKMNACVPLTCCTVFSFTKDCAQLDGPCIKTPGFSRVGGFLVIKPHILPRTACTVCYLFTN